VQRSASTKAIYQAVGFGNTYLITTSAGNVIVDTSLPAPAQRHRKLLQQVSAAPVRYIILTHGHGDHTGGIPLWKQPGTQIIAQRNHVQFAHYQKRLEGFFAFRNAPQFAFPRPAEQPWPGNYGTAIQPSILFDDTYEFTLGGVKFQLFHTPGETPDHLTAWIPQYKAALTGDNYYESFPNLYTLRGTTPRWPLDYVASLHKLLSLDAELVLPSHGRPIRGIYEGCAGWFDLDAATTASGPPASRTTSPYTDDGGVSNIWSASKRAAPWTRSI